uniref:Cysteine proteinase inhibitor n=1 Tax=Aegilops tauschii subsp. strangulata TaxID=200361 RepID=A0A453MBU1_AEGTS
QVLPCVVVVLHWSNLNSPLQNTQLELEKVVKVKEQAVAGRLYYITIQVDEGGAKKLYEAKVLEQLWLDVKKLVEFKPAEGASPNV